MSNEGKPRTFVWTVIVLLLVIVVGVNLYRGFTVKKIGIPSIFEIEFGAPTKEAQNFEILSFEAIPSRIRQGEFSTLRWQTSNAVEVTLDGRKVQRSDSKQVRPESTTTYELIARNEEDEKIRRRVEVEVSVPAPPEQEREPITIYPDVRDMGNVGGGGVSGSLTNNSSQPFSPPSFGDSGRGREIRGFLSFDLSPIGKGRIIHSAKFYAAMGGRSGDLDDSYFRTVVIEEIKIEGSIGQREFDDPGLSVSTVPLDEFRSRAVDVTNAVKRAYRNGQQHVTLRFRFSIGHDNDDERDIWAFSYSRAETKLVIEVSEK